MPACQQCNSLVTWGRYASTAQKQSHLCTECWNKPYNITSVCRADLQQILTSEEIARLDDGDMEYIARKMADAFCDTVFWEALEVLAEDVIEGK